MYYMAISYKVLSKVPFILHFIYSSQLHEVALIAFISQVGKSALRNETEPASSYSGELGLNPAVCPQELLRWEGGSKIPEKCLRVYICGGKFHVLTLFSCKLKI